MKYENMKNVKSEVENETKHRILRYCISNVILVNKCN